jgi:hypothetical protein
MIALIISWFRKIACITLDSLSALRATLISLIIVNEMAVATAVRNAAVKYRLASIDGQLTAGS